MMAQDDIPTAQASHQRVSYHLYGDSPQVVRGMLSAFLFLGPTGLDMRDGGNQQ